MNAQGVDEKVRDIRRAFGPAIGSRISAYSTAELLHPDGTWDAWPDLPVRLVWGLGEVIAVSWSKFDDLWIATDDELPFSVKGSTVRWVQGTSAHLDRAVGTTIRSVALGRGEMSIEGTDFEIWGRLLIQTESGWLEISNALDENGYAHYPERPSGEFIPCV